MQVVITSWDEETNTLNFEIHPSPRTFVLAETSGALVMAILLVDQRAFIVVRWHLVNWYFQAISLFGSCTTVLDHDGTVALVPMDVFPDCVGGNWVCSLVHPECF